MDQTSNTTRDNERLIAMVKAAGQEIIDRAEEIVGSTNYRTDFYITLDFPIGMNADAPTIEVLNKSIIDKALKAYIDFYSEATMFKEEIK